MKLVLTILLLYLPRLTKSDLTAQVNEFCAHSVQPNFKATTVNLYKELRPLTIQLLENQNTISDYSLIAQYTVPWIFFAVLSFLAWPLWFSLCCFDSKCPPVKCCRRDFKYDQYTRVEIIGPLMISVFLNCIIFGASIYGLTTDNEGGMLYSRCEIMKLFQKLQYSNSQFDGLINLDTNLGAIIDNYDSFQRNITNTFSSKRSQSLKSQYLQIMTINDQSQRGLTTSTLPIMTISNGSNTMTARESYFSMNKVFDYLLSYSVDSNYKELQSISSTIDISIFPQPDLITAYYSNLITNFIKLETNGDPLRSSNFQSNLVNGKNELLIMQESLSSSGDEFYQTLRPFGDYVGTMKRCLNAIFILSVIGSFISLVTLSILFFLGRYKARVMLHISWNLQSLLTILGFILAIFLHPSVGIFSDVCSYMQEYGNNAAFFQKSGLMKESKSKSLVYQCLYSNGDIYNQINLGTNIQYLKNFNDQMSAFNSQQGSITEKKTEFLQKMESNFNSISGIMDGSVLDLEATNSFQKNVIDEFNQLRTLEGCVEVALKICLDGNTPKRIDNNVDSLCWHPSYLITQENQCNEQLTYFGQLKSHFRSQSQSWTPSQQREQQIYQKNKDLGSNFQIYLNEIVLFNQQQEYLLKRIAKMGELNCKFIQQEWNQAIEGICSMETGHSVIALLIVCFCSLFGSMIGSIVGFRYFIEYTYGTYGSTKVHNYKDVEQEIGIMNVV